MDDAVPFPFQDPPVSKTCLSVPRLFRLFPFQGRSVSKTSLSVSSVLFRFKGLYLSDSRLFRFKSFLPVRFHSLPFQNFVFAFQVFSSVSQASLSDSTLFPCKSSLSVPRLLRFKSSLPVPRFFRFKDFSLRFKSSLPFQRLLFPIRGSSVASLLFPFQVSSVSNLLVLFQDSFA